MDKNEQHTHTKRWGFSFGRAEDWLWENTQTDGQAPENESELKEKVLGCEDGRALSLNRVLLEKLVTASCNKAKPSQAKAKPNQAILNDLRIFPTIEMLLSRQIHYL